MEKTLHTPDELAREAAEFVARLTPHEEGGTLVTLSGELGAGKTAFVKAAAKALGVDDVVTSPTFVLEKIYALQNRPFKNLVHIDAYRLEKDADLAPLGFDAVMKERGNLVMLEWPERVAGALPKPAHALVLSVLPNDARTLTYA